MKHNIKLLDCTLRDGGYYTNWDFEEDLVKSYAQAMEALPIDYVEVGYKSIPLKGYLGKYFYCPEYVLKNLKALMPTKKLAIILNEKDIRDHHIKDGLLSSIKNYVTLVRIAVDPKNIKRAITLAEEVKKEGFKVAFNVMYMSNWGDDANFLDHLKGKEHVLDYFYMVDSFGGVMPEEVSKTIATIKSKIDVPLGFHGHNNLELALINTIIAINSGCDIVDATITGMGRGAGNLKTELLLTYLESTKALPVTYKKLSKVVSDFEELREHYKWGTSLPYMFSGAKSLSQKQVMEWVGMNRYPLESIINALHNQNNAIEDNVRLPVLQKTEKYEAAVILGAGKTSKTHKKAVKKFLENNNESICLVHAGAKNVNEYIDSNCDQFYGLVGFESDKLLKGINSLPKYKQTCIYPPFPRSMGTSLASNIDKIAKELEAITFTNVTTDSPLALAIQTALDLGAKDIYFVGFDGYDVNINQNQFIISHENQQVLDATLSIDNVTIKTLTPTKYKNLETVSIYSLL